MKLLNDGSCRSGTQGRRRDDLVKEGSHTNENKTAKKKKKVQNSGSDTMLEI